MRYGRALLPPPFMRKMRTDKKEEPFKFNLHEGGQSLRNVLITLTVTEEQITTPGQFDFPHAMLFLNNKVFVGFLSDPIGKIIRFDDPYNNLNTQTTLAFPNDGNHRAIPAMIYDAGKAKIYCTFKNPSINAVIVDEIDPVTMARSTVINDSVSTPPVPHTGNGPIASDGSFLYVATFQNNPGQVLKYNINTFARVGAIVLPTGYDKAHAMVYDIPSGKLFVTGQPTPLTDSWIVQIDAASFTIDINRFCPVGDIGATDDFCIANNFIFVGYEGNNGDITVFSKNNLNNPPTRIPMSDVSSCFGTFNFNNYVWVTKGSQLPLGSLSALGRVDPFGFQTFVQLLPTTGLNELVGDGGTHLWVTYFQQPGIVARLRTLL